MRAEEVAGAGAQGEAAEVEQEAEAQAVVAPAVGVREAAAEVGGAALKMRSPR